MDREAVLASFDAEMRKDPPRDAGYRLERKANIIRALGDANHFISYACPTSAEAPDLVAEQAAEFRALGEEVEWKVYSYDRPAELPELLARAGFRPDPPETLMVRELAEPLVAPSPVPGLEIRQIHDEQGIKDAITAGVAAFGRDDGSVRDHAEGRLHDPTLGLFVAYLAGVPVSSGRVELPAGRSFASLWGGGTAPEHRGRGIYRTLVSVRAEFARARGYQYLTVDAQNATSRPILERLGFVPLAGIVGWILRPDPKVAATGDRSAP
ncbi:MAG: GNAT family N-acetyltransferase [Thermoplasmata archaeon]|nr:GNAT family N-acetyltransferase [Thermoplasmata archaeon]